MPWVRGHYARRSRTRSWGGSSRGRRYTRSTSAGLIVLVALVVVLLLYLATR